MLLEQLKLDPCFHILTGAVNSGKSMVVKKLMDDLKSRNVLVTDINLREVSFNSVESLVHTLKERTNSWLEQFVEAAEHCRLDAELYGFKLNLSIENPANASPIARLNTLLSSMQKNLPPYTFWYGTKLPVFIIDEANELRAITKDPNGQAALHNLLKWFVLNTKEL